MRQVSAPGPRLITLGETMVLVTPALAEPLAEAAEVRLEIGGAESNVAMHAAALGVPTAWISAIGDDALGLRLLRTVTAAGVDTRWVRRDPTAPTGVYFKDPGRGVLYYRRGSAASRLGPESIVDLPLERAEIVHLSGITPALSTTCASLIDRVIDRVTGGASSDRAFSDRAFSDRALSDRALSDGHRAILSFDVNHRAVLWPPGAAAPALLTLARRADLVFVGLDEASALFGCDSAAAVRELLPQPGTVVVKDGGIGATEFSATGTTFVPAIPTEVVEAVGAGDAFAAGYLAALLGGADTEERLRAGHERAQLVLQSTSDLGS